MTQNKHYRHDAFTTKLIKAHGLKTYYQLLQHIEDVQVVIRILIEDLEETKKLLEESKSKKGRKKK